MFGLSCVSWISSAQADHGMLPGDQSSHDCSSSSEDAARDVIGLTFEEGTSAAWLHDLLKPHVSQLVVCDPRKITPC